MSDIDIDLTDLEGDRIDRRTTLKLFSAAGMTGALAGCADDDVDPEQAGETGTDDGNGAEGSGTLRIGELFGEVTTLDHHRCSNSICYRTAAYMLDGLVDVDTNLEVHGVIAEDWEVPDDNTVIFNLREGVEWHNGDPFTAEDMVYSFERLYDDDFPGLYTDELSAVSDVVAEDDHTVRYDLERPYAPLFIYLTPQGRAGLPVNRTVAEEHGQTNYCDSVEAAAGNGPFELVDWVPRQRLTFEANENYWGDAPAVDTVEVHLIEDENALVNALISDEVDIAPEVPSTQLAVLENEDDVDVQTELTGNYHYIAFNLDQEPFDDQRVRRAIAMAIDRERIVEDVFQGYAVPNGYPMSPAFDWAYPGEPGEGGQQYDPEAARDLLAEAGYPDGFEVTMRVTTDSPWRSIGEWLAQELREELNLDLDVELLEWATFREYTASPPFEFEMFNLQWVGDIDPDQHVRMFHSESAVNRQYMDNPAVDELIDAQRAELDEAARGEVIRDLMEELAEYANYATFATQERAYAVREGVNGFIAHPAMYINVDDITLS